MSMFASDDEYVPTPEEKWDRQLLSVAADLLDEVDTEAIFDKLREEGWSDPESTSLLDEADWRLDEDDDFADRVREFIEFEIEFAKTPFRAAAEQLERSGNRDIFIGGVSAIGGTMATVVGWSATGDGGSIIILLGAAVIGGIELIRGITKKHQAIDLKHKYDL